MAIGPISTSGDLEDGGCVPQLPWTRSCLVPQGREESNKSASWLLNRSTRKYYHGGVRKVTEGGQVKWEGKTWVDVRARRGDLYASLRGAFKVGGLSGKTPQGHEAYDY